MITPEVDALRERYALPGMQVLQFLVGEEAFDMSSIPEHSVCYTGTHDNDTTRGWFDGGPGDTRPPDVIQRTRVNALRHTQDLPETIHMDLIRLAFSAESALAIAPMQDFLGPGSAARMNKPGTLLGNWQWRLSEQLVTPELLASVRQLVTAAGRA